MGGDPPPEQAGLSTRLCRTSGIWRKGPLRGSSIDITCVPFAKIVTTEVRFRSCSDRRESDVCRASSARPDSVEGKATCNLACKNWQGRKSYIGASFANLISD